MQCYLISWFLKAENLLEKVREQGCERQWIYNGDSQGDKKIVRMPKSQGGGCDFTPPEILMSKIILLTFLIWLTVCFYLNELILNTKLKNLVYHSMDKKKCRP